MWAHIYRLGDCLPSTEEAVEDHFGHSSDSKRSNKNPFKTLALERFHLQCSSWTRLQKEQWTKLSLQVDDISSTKSAPFKRVVNVGAFAPESVVLKKMRASSLQKTGPV
jgi:hypothetical protein